MRRRVINRWQHHVTNDKILKRIIESSRMLNIINNRERNWLGILYGKKMFNSGWNGGFVKWKKG